MSPRAYDTTNRRAAADATRDRICEAAEALFVARGYDRTSIRAVAGEAGVAEATVYLAFPNKPALLDATIVRATKQMGAAIADVMTAEPDALLARFAESNAETMSRSAHIIAVGEAAAASDDGLRDLRERAHDNLQAAMGAIAGRLHDAGLLHPGLSPKAAADSLYGIATETTYLRLTEDRGLTTEEYASWLSTTLTAVLLA